MRPDLVLAMATGLLAFCVSVVHGQTTDDFGSCPTTEEVKYDWERLNYYELLGLSKEDGSTEHLDSKAIRKAYRQQAQRWHPDKLKANETLPLDEINARFSAIGRAYEVLHGDDKRRAYHRFLKNCEYLQRQSNSHHPTGRQKSHDPNLWRTPSTTVRKERQIWTDPMTGIPFVRETTYEVMEDKDYYRITIQDYDPYQRPLYPFPKLIEEGTLYPPGGNQGHPGSQQRPQQDPVATDTLTDGDVLRVGQALVSTNQRFRAHVENCQLVVERTHPDWPEKKIVWRSPSFIGLLEFKCFLSLEEGQLMVAGVSPEFPTGHIFWFSSPDLDREEILGFGSLHTYTARLENDGKLVVYRVPVHNLERSQETCVFATGLFGCFRLVRQLQLLTEDAYANVTMLLDWLGLGGDDHGFAQDNEEKLPRLLLQKAIQYLKKLNSARRKVEVCLETKSLKLVYDAESWWENDGHRLYHVVESWWQRLRSP